MSVVVIGTGHAGVAVAAELRAAGFDGSITLLGEEAEPPYERPPLSKTGRCVPLRPDAFYRRHAIEVVLGARVVRIDRSGRELRLAGGARLPYRNLILATGARPRRLRLPGEELGQVLELRSLADARLLGQRLRPGLRLAVVGGGYLGLEVAARAQGLGCHVTVIEAERRLLPRVAGEALAEHLRVRHVAAGITVLTGARVIGLPPGRVELAGRPPVRCDAVLVAAGVAPRAELAAAAGLGCEDGILVDRRGRTGDPAVHALGDVTRRPVTGYGEALRLESVPSALEQARAVAADLCGLPERPGEVPWFWSDQHELKVRTAGLPGGTQIVTRADGDALAVLHLRDRIVRAVETVNAAREFAEGKRLIGEHVRLTECQPEFRRAALPGR
ncbi:NAD(P)/FAD-dependent oxidoreductase [Nonomuraea typhae]|uniref:NAD(P)/FAD-dependent oxidoreductase n=1 Tax=Nonomuraea typhae TaxID=2603600 RepID=UPI0012FAD5D0|nr:FAD-dependent oxidoreductase [Nonomuraea typhae]